MHGITSPLFAQDTLSFIVSLCGWFPWRPSRVLYVYASKYDIYTYITYVYFSFNPLPFKSTNR